MKNNTTDLLTAPTVTLEDWKIKSIKSDSKKLQAWIRKVQRVQSWVKSCPDICNQQNKTPEMIAWDNAKPAKSNWTSKTSKHKAYGRASYILRLARSEFRAANVEDLQEVVNFANRIA